MSRLWALPLLVAALLLAPSMASASSLELDSAGNQYANAGPDPSGSNRTSARTWEAWVKTTSNGQSQAGAGNNAQEVIARLVNQQQRPVSTKEAWEMDIRDGYPQMFIGRNESHNGPYDIRKANVIVNDGQWHHIAAVWEPGTRLDMYVDGHPANGDLIYFDGTTTHTNTGTQILSQLPVTDADVPMRIGVASFQDTDFGFFDGEIDGVRYSYTARYPAGVPFTPTTCPGLDEDTIGLWNFDEGSGTSSEGDGMVTARASLVNGAGFADGLSCAGALHFDGVDDYVQAGADPSASSPTNARTWEAWIRTTSNEYQTILGLERDGAGEDPWVLDMEDGIARIHVQDGSAHGARYASKTVNDGEWHHVAAVWDPGTRLDIYIDGTLADGPLGGGAVPSSIAVATTATMRIGAGDRDGVADGYFDGDIDGVQYSLTARYDGSFTPVLCPEADVHTVALWTFSEGEGDSTSPHNDLMGDATLENGAQWITGLACDTHDALLLNGNHQFVDAGVDPSADHPTTGRVWEAWVKTTSLGQTASGAAANYQAVFNRLRNQANTPTSKEEAWELSLVDGKPKVFIGRNASHGGPFNVRASTVAVNDGRWHHVAAVWLPGTSLHIYVDGQLADGAMTYYPASPATILSSLPAVTPDVSIRIGVGSFQDTDYGAFNGALDGVRYSYFHSGDPLPSPDIHPAADANTIALWNFDEGHGTTAAPQGLGTTVAQLLNGAGWTFGPR